MDDPVMKTPPHISLCMIVKDEERYLDECLRSVSPYVDEIVIVDTGSRDGTVEIARSHGAKVFFFEWTDSFADARNESLRHATGDWVIYLDADERLNPLDEADCVRRAASAEGVDAYSVRIVSHKDQSGRADFEVHSNIRMFRKLPGIHFVHEVHERVEPFLQEVGATLSRADFLIEHLGYGIDASDMTRKLERNLALSRKQLERNPDDAYALYYLGSALLVLEKKKESRRALEQALRGRGLIPGLQALILNLLGFLHFCDQEYELALTRANASLTALPHQYTAGLLLGLVYYHQQRYDSALEHLVRSHHFFSLPAELQQSEISQEVLLLERTELSKAVAICHLELGEYALAVPFFRQYIEYHAEDAEIFRLLGLCCLNAGDYPASIVYLRRAEVLGVDRAAIAVPLACAQFEVGNLQEAGRYLTHADAERGEDEEPTLRLLERMAGRREYSARYPEIFQQQKPLLQRASAEKLGGLARVLITCGWYELLLELCRWIDPHREAGRQLLGSLVEYHFENNQIDRLIDFLEELSGTYPECPPLLDALGVAYIKTADFPQAIAVYRQLEQVCPGKLEVRRRLAGLSLQVGDTESAHQWLAKNHRSPEQVCQSPFIAKKS